MCQLIHLPAINRRGINSTPQAEIHVQHRRVITVQDPLRVLVAEDSAIVSERLVSLIDGLARPIRVMAASNGRHASQLFDEMQPDVAVLDLALPGINGFELLTAFKSRHAACVVVMLTTYAHPVFREYAAQLGADFFFCKVLEFQRVAEVLASLTTPSAQP